jgi:hypothetical protein
VTVNQKVLPAGLALDADLASHHLHDLLGDRQSEPGAAVFARSRGVRLRKRPEQLRPLLLGEPDARVGHGVTEPDLLARVFDPLDAHQHVALLGELHRVGREVYEHLREAQRVAP